MKKGDTVFCISKSNDFRGPNMYGKICEISKDKIVIDVINGSWIFEVVVDNSKANMDYNEAIELFNEERK